jgi:hypothetical protein
LPEVGDEKVSDPFWALLAVLAILEVKHFIFDYPLQTRYHIENKGSYGHLGGIVHSGMQAGATVATFFAVTPSLALGAAIVAGEFVLHYHFDWGKDQINKRLHLTPSDRRFWWAIGADQLLHHLTYIAIAGILVGRTLGAG